MILDEIDLKILRAFLKLEDSKNVTDWMMMKRIYKNGKDREYKKIKRRIKKMATYNLFFIDDNNFILISDNVKHKKIKFDNKFVESICFFAENKWSAFEI